MNNRGSWNYRRLASASLHVFLVKSLLRLTTIMMQPFLLKERGDLLATENKPGEEVTKSEIYWVNLDPRHAEEHEIAGVQASKNNLVKNATVRWKLFPPHLPG